MGRIQNLTVDHTVSTIDNVVGSDSTNTTVLYNIADILNLAPLQNVYSTDETLIGSYLGKGLYRKMIPIVFASVGEPNLIVHNLSVENYVNILFKLDGGDIQPLRSYLKLNNLNIATDLSYMGSGQADSLIFAYQFSGIEGLTGHIILEYTKV